MPNHLSQSYRVNQCNAHSLLQHHFTDCADPVTLQLTYACEGYAISTVLQREHKTSQANAHAQEAIVKGFSAPRQPKMVVLQPKRRPLLGAQRSSGRWSWANHSPHMRCSYRAQQGSHICPCRSRSEVHRVLEVQKYSGGPVWCSSDDKPMMHRKHGDHRNTVCMTAR